MEVMLETLSNLIAMLLYMRLPAYVRILFLKVALEYRVNFFAIEAIDKHAILQRVLA